MDRRKNLQGWRMWIFWIHAIVLSISMISAKNVSALAGTPGADSKTCLSSVAVKFNYSRLDLSTVPHREFTRVKRLCSLDFSHNSIAEIPEYLFENKTRLEYLDLSDNRLTSGNFWHGLSSLKVLDISDNPIESFGPGFFSGLPNFTEIGVRRLELSKISAAMFGDNPTNNGAGQRKIEFPADYTTVDSRSIFPSTDRGDGIPIKVCIEDHHLKLVKVLKTKIPPNGCIRSHLTDGILNLDKLSIKTFASGWYRLGNYNVTALHLEYNKITRITKELLNDLPRGIDQISLRGNGIRKLKSGTIRNSNPIKTLDLRDNDMVRIERGALRELNLTDKLYLDNNNLVNTAFMDSLPVGIKFVSLTYNKIHEISVGNFQNFTQFHFLILNHNEISELPEGGPSGFSSLWVLDLSYNQLTTINPHFFRQLGSIVSLNLENNRLTEFNGQWFEHISELGSLSLACNVITRIAKGAAQYLTHLTVLDLSDNPIPVFGSGALFGLPKTNITEIKVDYVPIQTISAGLFDDL